MNAFSTLSCDVIPGIELSINDFHFISKSFQATECTVNDSKCAPITMADGLASLFRQTAPNAISVKTTASLKLDDPTGDVAYVGNALKTKPDALQRLCDALKKTHARHTFFSLKHRFIINILWNTTTLPETVYGAQIQRKNWYCVAICLEWSTVWQSMLVSNSSGQERWSGYSINFWL